MRKRPTVNSVRALMGLEAIPKTTLAEVPTVGNTIADIHEHARAIIYSYCGVEANYAMKAAETK